MTYFRMLEAQRLCHGTSNAEIKLWRFPKEHFQKIRANIGPYQISSNYNIMHKTRRLLKIQFMWLKF